MNKQLPNHIQEYLMNNTDGNTIASKEIFTANEQDVDIRTDITKEEITLISKLFYNDVALEKCGLNKLFDGYLKKVMRLRISKDRASRGEFVKINNADKSEDMINNFGNLSNILGARK